MHILILGSGGREHALAWRLGQSKTKHKIYLHPGNAGTARAGYPGLNLPANATADMIGRAAKKEDVSLVVVGPEVYLSEGYADHLRSAGFLVVGPNQSAAKLESSKMFAKQFMQRAEIPTASFSVVSSASELESSLEDRWPTVLKLDGLAAGKGVVVAANRSEAEDFADRIWRKNEFGPGPHRVVIEQYIAGSELSYMGLCDGERFIALSSATDYKRVGDGDSGPNTGGMGAISPSPYFSKELEEKIQARVITPALRQIARDKLDYRGILYVGLMITPEGDPYVLEFNARFGDPETQSVLPRLEGDFAALLEHTARGTLSDATAPTFRSEVCVYVVAAAEGYPAGPRAGDPIAGTEKLSADLLFFSGVTEKDGQLLTQGGRVLGVGSLGGSAVEARRGAYEKLNKISWAGMNFRKDIGLAKS